MPRYPYFDIDDFTPIALPLIENKKLTQKVVHRAGFSAGFKGPHIIVPQGVERSVGRVRAAYTEQDLVFQHSLQAIAFPEHEKNLAKILTVVLNSRLAAWFYFHETANLGTDRAKVVQEDLVKLPFAKPAEMPNPNVADAVASEIVGFVDSQSTMQSQLLRQDLRPMEELDKLVYSYYNLSDHDIALVEDTFNYVIPAMQPRRSTGMQKIWEQSNLADRKSYAETLCDAMKPWIRKPTSASLAARSNDVSVLKLTLSDRYSEYHEDQAIYLEDLLRSINEKRTLATGGNFQILPDLRMVIGSDIYIFKPMQLKHWLRSTALADAEQIAAELQNALMRDRRRNV